MEVIPVVRRDSVGWLLKVGLGCGNFARCLLRPRIPRGLQRDCSVLQILSSIAKKKIIIIILSHFFPLPA